MRCSPNGLPSASDYVLGLRARIGYSGLTTPPPSLDCIPDLVLLERRVRGACTLSTHLALAHGFWKSPFSDYRKIGLLEARYILRCQVNLSMK